MTMHALVVEDDEDIAQSVSETLASMGHSFDWVKSQEEAREKIGAGGYRYVLLDLQIPLRTGQSLASIEHGVNVAREIHEVPAMHGIPIIVMTAYGREGIEMAATLCEYGVVAFIHKPFPRTGRTMASVILGTLERKDRARETITSLSRDQKASLPFQGGDLVFLEDRIELCGVKIVGAAKSSQMWEILTCLTARLPNGRHKAFDGSTLAQVIKSSGGQGSIAGSIRDFRRHVADTLGREIGRKVGHQDIIESSSSGYRLKQWIIVRHAPAAPRAAASNTLNIGVARSERILHLLREGKAGGLRIPEVAGQLQCSASTVKRTLDALRGEGKVIFEGAPRNGAYKLV